MFACSTSWPVHWLHNISLADHKDSQGSSRPVSLKYLVHTERNNKQLCRGLYFCLKWQKFMACMEGCVVRFTINASSLFPLSYFLFHSFFVSRFLFPGIDLSFWLQTEIMKFFRLSVLILRWFSVRPSHGGSFQGTVSSDNTKHLCVSLCLATTLAVEVPERQACEVIFRGEKWLPGITEWVLLHFQT